MVLLEEFNKDADRTGDPSGAKVGLGQSSPQIPQ